MGYNSKKGEYELTEVVYKPSTFELDNNLLKPNGGKRKDKFFLYFSVLTICLIMVSCGSAFIWTSPMLPILKSNNTKINPLGKPITPYEESLIAGLISFGATVGALALGKLADLAGRKNMLIFFSIVEVAAYIALALGNNIYYFYVSRLVQGLVFGFCVTILPLYVAEITEDCNRGKFGSFIGMFIVLGNLYGFAIGPLFDLRTYSLLCGVPAVITIVIFTLFIPESPVYTASNGNREKAKAALKKFRDINSRQAEKALLEIEQTLRSSSSPNQESESFFSRSSVRKGLVVSIGLNMLQQASGICAILGFLGPIFETAKLGLPGNTSAILVGIMQVFGVIMSSLLIERLGRRILSLTSTILCCISLFVLGFYFYLDTIEFEYMDTVFWLPFACLVTFIVGYGLGLGPVPLIVTSEIFPIDFKSVAASISMFSSGVMASLSVFSFPIITTSLGVFWCFWIFSGICAVGVIFVYIFVPETKGKSFLEIEKIFNRR